MVEVRNDLIEDRKIIYQKIDKTFSLDRQGVLEPSLYKDSTIVQALLNSEKFIGFGKRVEDDKVSIVEIHKIIDQEEFKRLLIEHTFQENDVFTMFFDAGIVDLSDRRLIHLEYIGKLETVVKKKIKKIVDLTRMHPAFLLDILESKEFITLDNVRKELLRRGYRLENVE